MTPHTVFAFRDDIYAWWGVARPIRRERRAGRGRQKPPWKFFMEKEGGRGVAEERELLRKRLSAGRLKAALRECSRRADENGAIRAKKPIVLFADSFLTIEGWPGRKYMYLYATPVGELK